MAGSLRRLRRSKGEVALVRRILAWLLCFLGAFLLVISVLAFTVVPGKAKRTPLNVDTYTYLTGEADKLNFTTGEVEHVPVHYTSHTTVDPDISTDDVVAFVSTTCLNIDENDPPDCLDDTDDRLISNGTDTFATNRVTALAVDDPKFLADGATPHEGLVNKWPFDVEKKTYPYWDGTLGHAVDATYEGTEDIDGLETYVFAVDIPETEAEIAEGTDGLYAHSEKLYIDPVTGSIIKQDVTQSLKLPDGSTVLDLHIVYTDDTIKTNVDDADSNARMLTLLTKVLPWVSLVGGLLALAGGVLLLLSDNKRRRDTTQDGAGEAAPVGSGTV
jgi:Porin PorA